MNRRQVELVHDGDTKLVTWLPEDSRIKRGVHITLKEMPGIVWLVAQVYDISVDEQYFHRKWNFDYCEKLTGLKITPE